MPKEIFHNRKKTFYQNLYSELEQGIDIIRLEKQFEKLKIQKQIVNPTGDLWNLSDDVFEKYKEADKEQKDLEKEAEKRFIELVMLHCKDINPVELWDDFKSKDVITSCKGNWC